MSSYKATQPSSIQTMFASIAKRYDLVNSVLSLGIHSLWKRKLVRLSRIQPGQTVLDCATGTGDLAFLFEKKAKGGSKIIGTDFCEPMLVQAQEKAEAVGSAVRFEWADVTHLPYPDHQFDLASISFGIRNVSNPLLALKELARVVKPGGTVFVLEFGQPQNSWIRALFNLYSTRVLPKLGGWLSGKREAYQYLQTSSAQFPCAGDFLDLASTTTAFKETRFISLSCGIAYLYILKR